MSFVAAIDQLAEQRAVLVAVIARSSGAIRTMADILFTLVSRIVIVQALAYHRSANAPLLTAAYRIRPHVW